MRRTVRIADQKLWVDSTPIPLLSGEVHYWRLSPENWRPSLERARELGLEIIATYICWDFHETAPGAFDFDGRSDPRRNLAGFLDLLAEMGFWIIIRPGPYIYAEWSNAGVPEYAARYHRLDPAYLPLARRYLEAVAPVLLPRLATHGGKIILCQAENEIDCWPHMYTEALGLGSQGGLFQAFLAERYGTVSALNAAWNSAYPSFDTVRAVLALPPGRADWMPRYLDYYRFKHWYVVRVVQWTVKALRLLGVDVPVYTNTIQTHANEPWAAMERASDLTGTDLYPSNTFHHPDEHRKFLEAARYLRSYSRLPYIAEFEAGVWHGAHVESQVGALEARHYRMAAVSALLTGVAGWNWYMLVDRDNWSRSPVNEWGRIRPDVYTTFRQLVALYQEIDPPGLEKLTTLAATVDPIQQAQASGSPEAHPESELLRSLYEAGLDYDFYDVNPGQVDLPLQPQPQQQVIPPLQPPRMLPPVLFYAGGQWLCAEGQVQLYQYVEAGGHLVCVGCAPRLDDAMRPLNRLSLPDPQGVIGDMSDIALTVALPGAPVSIKTRWMEIFDQVPGEPITAERQSVDAEAVEEMQFLCSLPVGARYTIGYTQPRGQGRLTYLGIQPTPQLLLGLCSAFSAPLASSGTSFRRRPAVSSASSEAKGRPAVPPPVRAATPGVTAALFRRKGSAGRFYLMVVNTGSEAKVADLRFAPGLFAGTPRFRSLLDGETLAGIDPLRAFLPVGGKDGAVFEVG